jgi:uroporphyrinogen III methyltransferase/synthase
VAGRVYLVGAGPGDPELITERGARRLAEADLVLYDALAHPSLLGRCRPGCETVFVGKRAGRVSERQDEITRRLIDAARAGKRVVRLKGGDPYLFGRGSEEAEALAAAGIPFEVVPGVPSPLAATAYAGISLTHRSLSSSVAYLTASESPEKDRSSHAWDRLATATETLVIFMGLGRIRALMSLLLEHGRDGATPAALISRASTADQRTLVATVATLADLVESDPPATPALVVVGEVVRLREQLRWYDRSPLFGARVLVTRPEGQEDELLQLLRDAGAAPIHVPAIRIEAPPDPLPLARLAGELDRFDWVVFTSANGVRGLHRALEARGRDARAYGRAKVLAIGTATARALRDRGIEADLVPAEFRGEAAADALIAALGDGVRGARVVLARAEVAREVLPRRLADAGALVEVVPTYRNVVRPEDQARMAQLLRAGEIDLVTLTAPSTAESLAAALGADAAAVLAERTLVSIGPVTTEAAERLGLRVAATASTYTAAGLFEALLAHAGTLGEPPWQRPGRRVTGPFGGV